MNYLLASAFLFGLVHPGSKFFLDQGIDLRVFCALYIGIRFVCQIPLVLKSGDYKLRGIRQFKTALGLGLIGSCLLLTEFAGIASGEDVSKVTFLVYTHPLWSLLLSKKVQEFKINDLFQLGLALTGVSFLIEDLSVSILLSNGPSILAGLLIALWVKQSSSAIASGFTPLKLSFYYDLMSLLCLIAFMGFSTSVPIKAFHVSGTSVILLIIYSLVVGLLPNILFYKGTAKVPALTAGYILLLEPVISAVIGSVIWNEVLGPRFFVGAILILSVNLPFTIFLKFRRSGISAALFLIGIIINPSVAYSKSIHLLEIIPSEGSDYTINAERKQLEIAAEMAFSDISLKNQCNVKLNKILKTGNEETLVKEIKGTNFSADDVLVGLSRSNFARVAAKVSSGSRAKAISVGASASNLGEINSKFITVVNPWQEQFFKIQETLRKENCSFANTLGVFNGTDYLSQNFKESFVGSKLGIYVDYESFRDPGKYKCLFMGMKFSESVRLFEKLKDWKGALIGIGDWNINTSELEKSSTILNSNITMHVPTGWLPSINIKSSEFARKFKERSGIAASPIAAYTYDATILAYMDICSLGSVFSGLVNHKLLLRDYISRNGTGNLISPLSIRQISGRTK